jgi:type VI secretion system protein ImpK
VDHLNQITADCFNAVSQLRELEGAAGVPEAIHRRMQGYMDAMRGRAREQGMPQRDGDDIAYALAALIDEIAMGKAEPLAGYWMARPLQLQYFNENLAGEGFFLRLEELRRDSRRIDVLRVYYQCLLLGFQGKFSMRGGELELMRMVDQLRTELERQIERPDHLSPAGEPPDEPLLQSSQRNPFLWAALGVFAVAIAVFIGLRLSLNSHVSALVDRVEELYR